MLEQPEFQVVDMKIFLLCQAVIVEGLHVMGSAPVQRFVNPQSEPLVVCKTRSMKTVSVM